MYTWPLAVIPSVSPAVTVTLVFVHSWLPDTTKPGVDVHPKADHADVP
jgi:hypothetical protein